MPSGHIDATKLNPLSDHAKAALRELLNGDIPRQNINSGVAERLERGDLVRIYEAPTTFASHRKGRLIRYLSITLAGREAAALTGLDQE